MSTGSMNQRNQLQWVLLLAAAVVLPTVSLLWFMSRVVANERLVIRQKLSAVYQKKLEDAGDKVERSLNARFDVLNKTDWAKDPYGLLHRVVLDEHMQGVVLWSPEGALVYPAGGELTGSGGEVQNPSLTKAWQLEFVDKDYAAAAGRYSQLANSADPRVLAGQVRCLARLGRYDDAVATAMKQQNVSAAPARLLLLSRLGKTNDVAGRKEMVGRLINALDSDLFKPGRNSLPADQNLMIARRLIECMQKVGRPDTTKTIARLTRLADAETLSIAVHEIFPRPTGPTNTTVTVSVGGKRLYVTRYSTSFGEMLIVMSNAGLASELDEYRTEFDGSDAQLRIVDSQGDLLAGEPGKGISAIAATPLPRGFPEGRIELFFSNGDIFNQTAGREIAVYVWTGVLVILLMLVVGAFALQAVGRQIRLNRIKNDFIATVSHELKTPLASMRLLVDTLLEKRVRDEEHAEEYLRMIAKENERLTRMIENFLTFSRMERNKNAFSMVPASPNSIIEDAIDSVCTKYEANGCRLDTQIAGGLPDIPADHDAIVTVLINLLDNACKYTTDDKRINLSVCAEDDEVCFAVADHGIGMSRRQVRKIFDSFYQVDSSLARAAEGCGLGLSIVRFIVNAHKGRIDVESQPGQGCTITVRLPISRKNGA